MPHISQLVTAQDNSPVKGASVSCQQLTATEAGGWSHRLVKNLGGVLSVSTHAAHVFEGLPNTQTSMAMEGAGGIKIEGRDGFLFRVR